MLHVSILTIEKVAKLLPIVVSMALGLNPVVYPEGVGMDASDNARMCFVSYLMAIIVLPLAFGVLTKLV